MKDKIAIWQQNVNKSPTCQHNLLSNNELAHLDIDIIALQEPAINAFNLSIASKDWTPVYPTTHGKDPEKISRSLILVRSHISSDSWNQIDFPSSDVTVIQLNGNWGKLTIFNIYNDGNHNDTINLLSKYHRENSTARRPETERSTEHIMC